MPARQELKQIGEALILRLFGATVLCCTLVAGLWPFHAPRNKVTWLAGRPGVRFRHPGTVVSSGVFKLASDQHEENHSFEIWMTPNTRFDRQNTILAFYAPPEGEYLSIYQAYADFIFASDVRTAAHQIRRANIYLEDLPHPGKSVFVTVTSQSQKTAVWIDGSLTKSASPFPVPLDGQMVLGTSADRDFSWTGDVHGLALYDSALKPEQVLTHYRTWTTMGKPQIAANDRAVALYLFDEGGGVVIHDVLGLAPSLEIPERYTLLHEKFLEPFWQEFAWARGYWNSVVVNVVGLVPLGFIFCAYFTSVRGLRRAVLATVILGFMVSLTIEVLQSFLPTRDSGTTDLFTNTLGTYLGTVLYLRTRARDLLQRVVDSILAMAPG